jgi:hypothetical protein
MKQVINNDKLKKILEERTVLQGEIKKIVDEMVVLDKDRLKLGYKMDKLKEKTKIIMDSIAFSLEEFEFLASVDLNSDGEPEVTIIDQIEEYKRMVREEKAKKFNA